MYSVVSVNCAGFITSVLNWCTGFIFLLLGFFTSADSHIIDYSGDFAEVRQWDFLVILCHYCGQHVSTVYIFKLY